MLHNGFIMANLVQLCISALNTRFSQSVFASGKAGPTAFALGYFNKPIPRVRNSNLKPIVEIYVCQVSVDFSDTLFVTFHISLSLRFNLTDLRGRKFRLHAQPHRGQALCCRRLNACGVLWRFSKFLWLGGCRLCFKLRQLLRRDFKTLAKLVIPPYPKLFLLPP